MTSTAAIVIALLLVVVGFLAGILAAVLALEVRPHRASIDVEDHETTDDHLP